MRKANNRRGTRPVRKPFKVTNNKNGIPMQGQRPPRPVMEIREQKEARRYDETIR